MSELEGAAGAGRADEVFAARLDELFRQPSEPSRSYSSREVATALTGRGVSVSPQYLWMLRRGRRRNPSQELIGALAEFFGVPPGYFYGDVAESADESRADVHGSVDGEVLEIAARMRGLSPDAVKAVRAMIDHVRRTEGLADE